MLLLATFHGIRKPTSVCTNPSTNYLLAMKAAFILLVLACAMAVVYGDLVCGTNFCKKNPCVSSVSSKSCNHPSVYRANHAGMCSCCPACVTFLGENAACKKYDKEIGQTPSAICREPLKCLNGVCVKVPARN